MSTFTFTVRGARGGRPAIGPAFTRYGSHTTCFSMETEEGFLIFDAGTAIETLSDVCLAAGPEKPIAVFLTHFHFDHTIGLSAFEPIYRQGYNLHFYAVSPSPRHPWPDILKDLIDEPYWPVPMRSLPSNITYHDLDQHTQPVRVSGADVSWCELTHTQRCLGYRIALQGGSIVILTDHEPQLAPNRRVEAFCAGANIVIMDAQYRPEEYGLHRGWGHGTWQDATDLAREAGVSQLILCHHDPQHTDDDLDAIQRQARKAFPRTDVAREQMTLAF